MTLEKYALLNSSQKLKSQKLCLIKIELKCYSFKNDLNDTFCYITFDPRISQ